MWVTQSKVKGGMRPPPFLRLHEVQAVESSNPLTSIPNWKGSGGVTNLTNVKSTRTGLLSVLSTWLCRSKVRIVAPNRRGVSRRPQPIDNSFTSATMAF
jgi:hypothetical protein